MELLRPWFTRVGPLIESRVEYELALLKSLLSMSIVNDPVRSRFSFRTLGVVLADLPTCKFRRKGQDRSRRPLPSTVAVSYAIGRLQCGSAEARASKDECGGR